MKHKQGGKKCDDAIYYAILNEDEAERERERERGKGSHKKLVRKHSHKIHRENFTFRVQSPPGAEDRKRGPTTKIFTANTCESLSVVEKTSP